MRAALHDGGTDVACDAAYPSYVLAAYYNGSVSLEDLQTAGANFLRQAFALGLMDPADQASDPPFVCGTTLQALVFACGFFAGSLYDVRA